VLEYLPAENRLLVRAGVGWDEGVVGKATVGADLASPAGFALPREAEQRGAPSGVELVATAVQAAGELAQIGLAVGGQALKSALGRLGRS